MRFTFSANTQHGKKQAQKHSYEQHCSQIPVDQDLDIRFGAEAVPFVHALRQTNVYKPAWVTGCHTPHESASLYVAPGTCNICP